MTNATLALTIENLNGMMSDLDITELAPYEVVEGISFSADIVRGSANATLAVTVDEDGDERIELVGFDGEYSEHGADVEDAVHALRHSAILCA